MLNEMKEVVLIPPVSLAWPEGCPLLQIKRRENYKFCSCGPKTLKMMLFFVEQLLLLKIILCNLLIESLKFFEVSVVSNNGCRL